MRAPESQRLAKTEDSTKKAIVVLRLDLTQGRGRRIPDEARTPTAVKSFLIVTSRRIFLESRKSASRPPRMMQTQPNMNGRADRIPLWRLGTGKYKCPQHFPVWDLTGPGRIDGPSLQFCILYVSLSM